MVEVKDFSVHQRENQARVGSELAQELGESGVVAEA